MRAAKVIHLAQAPQPGRSSDVLFGVKWGSEKSSPSQISATQYLDRLSAVRENDLLLSAQGEGEATLEFSAGLTNSTHDMFGN